MDARATNLAVERFYTTAECARERATEGWRRSTILTKETTLHMDGGTAAPWPVSRWGVAGNRDGAVFCQERPARPPRSCASVRRERPAAPARSRRYQDQKHER